mmetsp:Transcript_43709/g.56056  ORF Transcript_43709/g.56056 Transcript_43709/m.56056 type:complete len:96 (+) Transcript_43709:65-352(+)
MLLTKKITKNKNKNKKYGGGVQCSGVVLCQIDSSQITFNTATIDGGGVHLYACVVSLTTLNISHNNADTGGGLFLSDGTELSAHSLSISNNKAVV